MNLPKFLCIGAQKAGTSWLYVQLAKHPEIWMPPVKELHFFDHLYVPQNRKWTAMHIRSGVKHSLTFHLNQSGATDWAFVRYLADMAQRQIFTEAWYKRCYERPKAKERLCGDITPEYCMIPDEGVAHVAQLLSHPKVIYIVREPVSRALSQLRMNAERRKLDNPDLQTWQQMASHPDIDSRGDYASYIPRWQKHIPPEHLLILPYGDIARDAIGFLRRVETFLGLSPGKDYEAGNRVHQTRRYDMPSALVDELTQRFAAQTAYLRTTFGEDFFSRTR